jgi:hypothetical protein
MGERGWGTKLTTLAVDGTRFYLPWEKGVGGRSVLARPATAQRPAAPDWRVARMALAEDSVAHTALQHERHAVAVAATVAALRQRRSPPPEPQRARFGSDASPKCPPHHANTDDRNTPWTPCRPDYATHPQMRRGHRDSHPHPQALLHLFPARGTNDQALEGGWCSLSVRYGRRADGGGQRAADAAEPRVGAAGVAELEIDGGAGGTRTWAGAGVGADVVGSSRCGGAAAGYGHFGCGWNTVYSRWEGGWGTNALARLTRRGDVWSLVC